MTFYHKLRQIAACKAKPLIIYWINYARYRKEFVAFVSQSQKSGSRFSITWKDRYVCLDDKTETTPFERHYLYHPAWAARVLNRTRPSEHIDISSVLSFCAVVSAFIPIRFYDYRPANLHLSDLVSEHADLTALPFDNNSIPSLSCMHTVEHIGLGRYGDPLDPDGDLKAMQELNRVLAPNGSLLLVVPVGRPRVQFNAHRIYSYNQIMEYFANLELVQFSLIPNVSEEVGIIDNATREMADAEAYGCGCFWLRKPANEK